MDEDLVTRESNIKYNLQSYLPYICECVDSKHLLLNLDCFTGEQRREITQLMRVNPTGATQKAFDTLMAKEQDGLFISLLHSFEEDFPKIAKLLKGDTVKCDERYRRIVNLFTKTVINEISPLELLIPLRKYNVLTAEEQSETMAEEKNFGEIRASFYIIANIHRHLEDWFKFFIMSLIEAGYEDLALKLDEDMVQKIKSQADAHCDDKSTDEVKQSDDVRKHVLQVQHGAYVSKKNEDVPLSQKEDFTKLLYKRSNEENAEVKDCNDLGEHDLQVQQDTFASTNVYNVTLPEKGAYTKVLYKRNNGENIDEVCNINICISNRDEIQKTYYNNFDEFDDDDDDITALKARAGQIDDITTLKTRPGQIDDITALKRRAGQIDDITLAGQIDDITLAGQIDDITTVKIRAGQIDDITLAGQIDDITSLKTRPGQIDDITALKKRAGQIDGDGKESPVENSRQEGNESSDTDDDLDDNDLNADQLNIIVPEDIMRNITTDHDELTDVAEHTIELRGYQKKLAKQGCEGENVIVMAPTNSGKTKVACEIVLSVFKHCEEQGKKGKAAFVVEREDLAIQQGEVFCQELPGYRTKVITGYVQQNRDQYLKDYIERRDIFMVTAQVLLNFLKSEGRKYLEKFDIIVFDECHHADKKHPYKKIMDNYFELRLQNDGVVLPQIIGLTASIGVGGKLDRIIALENMKTIAANLDVKVLCTVESKEDKAEMKEYLDDPVEHFVEVERRATERFYEDILDILEKIDDFMMNNPHIAQLEGGDKFMKTVSRVPTVSVGTPQFQSWISDFRHGLSVLKSDNARQILSPCLEYIDQYHNAVLLYTDARICDALKSLGAFVDKRRQADFHNVADQFLMENFDGLRAKSFKEEPENPKIIKLQELIIDTIGNDENSRGIIFVKTRALAKILKKWMHQTPELKHLNANAFIGKVHSSAVNGMTGNIQKNVVSLFKNGKHKLVIATTVAEEGLDIGLCNLVIKYEHVTNEKARVQCKGRLRARNSKYFVLTERGSRIIEKEEFNARCEKLMLDLIPVLKNYMEENRNRWEGEILQKQRYAKEVREAQSRQRQAYLTDDTVNLHCGNCGAFICSSEDVKKICGMHHIVVTDVREKIVLERSLKPRHVDKTNEIIMGGNVFCSNEMCIYKHKIGGIVQYKKIDFPVLAIKNICIKSLDGKMLPNAKQWSKVVFKVESIDATELGAFIQDRYME